MNRGVERRDFLRALGRTLRHPLRETERLAEAPMRLPPERVLVLGAGAAGLGAARALAAEDVHVTVIEARDRVGGRAWTADAHGIGVDLGAAFVQGTEANPVADLADYDGVGLVVCDLAATVLIGDDRVLTPEELDAALERYDALLARLVAVRDVLGVGASVGDGIAALGPDGADREVRRLLHAEVAVAHAADLERLSLAALLAAARLPGDDAVVPGGLGALVGTLAEDLDVRHGEEVVHVEHGGDEVVVRTTLGEHRADRAILTLPHGVLAAGAVTFDPPLPPAVRAALATLDAGRVATIAARLPEPLLPAGAEFVAGPVERPGEVGAWAAFDDVAGEPVLVGWAVGSAADALPADDAEAVAGALACLAARLGRTAPDPTWAAVARWADDPYTLGATTFVPAGADPALRVALAGMASPRLLLAGEAGATDHPGTVHGALSSGEREASRCIDLMRQAQ